MALNYTSLITCSINEIEFFQVYVSRTQGDLNFKFLISLGNKDKENYILPFISL